MMSIKQSNCSEALMVEAMVKSSKGFDDRRGSLERTDAASVVALLPRKSSSSEDLESSSADRFSVEAEALLDSLSSLSRMEFLTCNMPKWERVEFFTKTRTNLNLFLTLRADFKELKSSLECSETNLFFDRDFLNTSSLNFFELR